MLKQASIRFGQETRLRTFRWTFTALAIAAVCGLAAASVPSSRSASASAPHSSTHTSHPTRRAAHKPSAEPSAHHGSAHSATAAHGKTNPHGKKPSTAASKKSKGKSAKRGQQAIDPSRAREIQEALIREHYLDGEPSGSWDSSTQAAMQRYQEDQGWQSKTTPDSRALIKLGLGPSRDRLLNPESAMTMPAATLSADSKTPAKQGPAENSTPKQ